MARLALLAMLALALVPSVGRFAQQMSWNDADRGASLALGAMCTTRGLAYDATVATIEQTGFSLGADDESPAPPSHVDDDCDYCTIAAASLLPVPASAAALAPVVEIASPARAVAALAWHYPLGLGSRGPPLTV